MSDIVEVPSASTALRSSSSDVVRLGLALGHPEGIAPRDWLALIDSKAAEFAAQLVGELVAEAEAVAVSIILLDDRESLFGETISRRITALLRDTDSRVFIDLTEAADTSPSEFENLDVVVTSFPELAALAHADGPRFLVVSASPSGDASAQARAIARDVRGGTTACVDEPERPASAPTSDIALARDEPPADQRAVAAALLARIADEEQAMAPDRLSSSETGGDSTGDDPTVEELRAMLTRLGPLPTIFTQPHDFTRDSLTDPGWRFAEFAPLVIAPDIDWYAAAASHRSWNFRLHAWDFMQPLLDGCSGADDVSWCVDVALSWGQAFADGGDHGTLAWYDMALAQRATRLAQLTARYVVEGPPGNEPRIEALRELVELHRRKLEEDAAFAVHTNHGVFTALGGIYLASQLPTLSGMGTLGRLSRRRLREVTLRQFLGDGGHAEHSPDYHRMMLNTYSRALTTGLITDAELRRTLVRAEYVLGWYIQPDGGLVQVGDSNGRPMSPRPPTTSDPHTTFLQTAGTAGRRDDRNLLVLPETGVAIVRDPQPSGAHDMRASSYLMFSAAFHSRAHKHADDLSLTWFDAADEILIDPGRFGYGSQVPVGSAPSLQGFYYADPERQFVETTRAHNTVEVDGVDHVRRGRQPFGSGLGSCVQIDGLHVLTGSVDHEAWRHRRRVVLRPGHWLIASDDLEVVDGAAHTFRQWWNVADVWDMHAARSHRARFTRPDGIGLWITETTGAKMIAPVRGQREPLRGWRSKADRTLTPTWSFGFEHEGGSSRFVTVFIIGAKRPRSREISAIVARARHAWERAAPPHERD